MLRDLTMGRQRAPQTAAGCPHRSRYTVWAVLYLAVAGMAGPSAQAGSAVWRWFADCPATHRLAIRVTLDGAVLFDTVVPICRTQVWDKRVLSFVFSAPRAIAWSGYRDEARRSSPGERIRGDIRLAEGDDDGLLLGVRFSTSRGVLSNTVHGAAPRRLTRSSIVRGLVIVTVGE
jgi:hypothetical protein